MERPRQAVPLLVLSPGMLKENSDPNHCWPKAASSSTRRLLWVAVPRHGVQTLVF